VAENPLAKRKGKLTYCRGHKEQAFLSIRGERRSIRGERRRQYPPEHKKKRARQQTPS